MNLTNISKSRSARPLLSYGLAWGVLVVATTTSAAPIVLTYDSRSETKTIGSPLTPGHEIRLDGVVRSAGSSSLTNVLQFKAGSSSLSLSAGWLLSPVENRTVGVNIDLFDSLTNTLVASDVFLGVNGSLASSQLVASNLISGGNYTLVFTGSAAQAGRYQIDLVDGQTPPPVPSLAATTPPENLALFDTHFGEKQFGDIFSTGDTLQIDGVLADDQLSAIQNNFKFALNTSTLSAGIEWIVGLQDDPQRTVGVNVDLFDSFLGLVATDTFNGVINGQGFSQLLATGLVPGAYTLIFTGNAALAGRYQINLSTDVTPPGFDPIGGGPLGAVPEPGTLPFLAFGFAALVTLRSMRRKRTTRGCLTHRTPA